MKQPKKVQHEIEIPRLVANEVLNVLEVLKEFVESDEERQRIQQRIDNLNVSPLQQRINNIRKIAEEAKDRIDRVEDRGPWYRGVRNSEFARFGVDIGVQFTPFSKQWERGMYELREMDRKAHTPKDIDREYDPLSKYRNRNK